MENRLIKKGKALKITRLRHSLSRTIEDAENLELETLNLKLNT